MTYEDKRILLVEDNDMNRMMASISFSDYEVEIEEAVNGQEAVDKFNDNPEGYYDIIFMDILMPVMDGIAATEKIRTMESLYAMGIPIIAMTAESDPDEIAKYSDYGFTDYIEKPMDMDELDRIMEEYLG